MKLLVNCILISLFAIVLHSCNQESTKNLSQLDSESRLVHLYLDHLNKAIVNDIFSPPVASRIYAYSFLAGKLSFKKEENKKFLSSIKQKLDIIPIDTSQVDPYLVALLSMQKVGADLVFSNNYLSDFRDTLDAYIKKNNFNQEKYLKSEDQSQVIFNYLKKELISTDGYAETRTMNKYTLGKKDPSAWIPTPPDYLDALEPHWSKISPFYLESSEQFAPENSINFSTEKDSKFWVELEKLYSFVKDSLDSERMEVAEFWDCNPFVTEHVGHYMKGVKKITPGGHWMGIGSIIAKNKNLDPYTTIDNFSLLSSGMMDAFISCWDEKYRSKLIRPETLINLHIDPEWKPVLVTPSFPEYPSGHSVVSGTASTILTHLYGDNVSFVDDTEVAFGLPIRSFSSFNAAADEAAISRYYGGIHYKPAIYDGLQQGKQIGKYIINALNDE